MTEKDWVCKACGGTMLKTSEEYLVCENGCGRLRPAPSIAGLPVAERVDYRRFKIKGREGFWEYVPHAHKEALERRPGSGVVVAQVISEAGIRARVFRLAKAPRKLPTASCDS